MAERKYITFGNRAKKMKDRKRGLVYIWQNKQENNTNKLDKCKFVPVLNYLRTTP